MLLIVCLFLFCFWFGCFENIPCAAVLFRKYSGAMRVNESGSAVSSVVCPWRHALLRLPTREKRIDCTVVPDSVKSFIGKKRRSQAHARDLLFLGDPMGHCTMRKR